MQHLIRNILIILVVLTVCISAIFPPEANLKRGKDLAGGVSLIYTVQLGPTDDSGTVDNVIEVLKDRVDPNGLFEISFVKQGRDRIEITMPLPTAEVKALREAYEAELAELADQALSVEEFENVLRLEPDARAHAIARLSGDSERRRELLDSAAAAFDRSVQARRAFDEAQESNAPEEEINRLLREAGPARVAYEQARSAVLAASVNVNELDAALQLPMDAERIRDDATGEVVELPSPRMKAIARLKETHPDAADQIDEVVTAHDVYLARRRGLDDPNDLKRLLRGAGVLNFRIAVKNETNRPDVARLRADLQELGPRRARATDAAWFQIHDPSTWYTSVQEAEALRANPGAFFAGRNLVGAERDGVYYILLYDTPGLKITEADGDWSVTAAFPSQDQQGRPAIGFQMDPRGARLLGKLTGANVGEYMAVVLDDKVYTAPVLQGRITSNGQIAGNFPQREINYLRKTLASGSLQARLSEEPISEEALGPELGADNLRKGFFSAVVALVAVAAFMMVYYMTSGVIAVFALFCNAVIILGAMALNRTAFSLPGIAGIVLTFGMAVDSNVLIYERIREELEAGLDLRSAVRLGYQKVLSTIVDANITNLIVCFVLYYTATTEIRGFAITLGVGIVATLFSSLFITRVIFTILVDGLGLKRLPQLPTVLPALQRLLSPKIDWLSLRTGFLVISGILLSIGVGMVVIQGKDMLGHQFLGGTQVEITLRVDPETGEALKLTREQVQERIANVAAGEETGALTALARGAEVLPISPDEDGVTASAFRIRTTLEDAELVKAAVVESMGDVVDVRPALTFTGADAEAFADSPVFAVLDPDLGKVIGRSDVSRDASDFIGGVAILLEELSPPPTVRMLEERIEQLVQQVDFSELGPHTRRVVVIEGANDAVRTAVVLASAPDASYLDDQGPWRTTLAEPEWRLAREALTTTTTLASVQSFSAQIAATFQGRAIVAILLSFLGILMYIWVRFGSLRYSLAAIAALSHDVLAVVGLIALAEIVYEAAPGLATALYIEPFKIDLGLVAALLTIIGYSLNDTIVILDRIRENRGKLAHASREVVNLSINQCISRTVITSGTTLIAVGIMYVWGGEGIRSFTYALLCGVVVGTYSSVAVAAPLVWSRTLSTAPPKSRPASASDSTSPPRDLVGTS